MVDYTQDDPEKRYDGVDDRPAARALIGEFFASAPAPNPLDDEDTETAIARILEMANHFSILEIELDYDTFILAWTLVEAARRPGALVHLDRIEQSFAEMSA